MRLIYILTTVAVASLALGGCSAEKESPEPSWGMTRLSLPDTLLPTPTEVKAEFLALIETADPERPGANARSLHEFLRRNISYEIADTVRIEVERHRTAAVGRYHSARELVRQGQFDRARQILEDLAHNLPNTQEGESARAYLAFDFDMGKAKWLMVRQRFVECEAVARALLERDLTPNQIAQVEDILDSVGYVAAAQVQAERSTAENACQQLRVMLANIFVERGVYPSTLTLEDVEELDPYISRDIMRGLSAIEDYRITRDGYSLVAVSARGNHRVRIVDGDLQ
jgi:hypothetical protein